MSSFKSNENFQNKKDSLILFDVIACFTLRLKGLFIHKQQGMFEILSILILQVEIYHSFHEFLHEPDILFLIFIQH